VNSSSAFRIGSTHKVCQDYAVSGKGLDGLYVAISDGCSSSPNSEFGAMIQCRAFELIHKTIDYNDPFKTQVLLEKIRSAADLLKMPYTCLDATLLTAVVQGNRVRVDCVGDGIVAVMNKDDSVTLIDVEFISNAPLYYSYFLEPGRLRSFVEMFGKKRKVTTRFFSSEGDFNITTETSDCSLENIPVSFSFDTDKTKLVSVMSDGVKSFFQTVDSGVSRTNQDVPFQESVMELMLVKSFSGDFMERRMNKFLKMCEKDGVKHADDVSVGTIYIGEE